jgi:hypothetical protein
VRSVTGIIEYARWLEELDPGFLAFVLLVETGKDYRRLDLLAQIAILIELFGLDGAAGIVGCPYSYWKFRKGGSGP